MTQRRVLLLTRVLASYRITLYQKLARLPGWDLSVVHGLQTREAAAALVDSQVTLPFTATGLRNIEHELGSLTLRWQRGALGAARKFQPEILIISSEVGTVSTWVICAWARISGRTVIMWTSFWEPHAPSSMVYHLKRFALRLYFSLASETIVYSTRARCDLMELGISGDRITVCHNGIEVDDRLQREPEIRSAAADLRRVEAIDDRMLFLYVGRMTSGKSLDLMITAFGELDQGQRSVLWVVGDGPELTRLEAQVADRGMSNVKFWGQIFDDVDSYFAAADCFVLPGLGGLALNQAMVFGVPCICSVADGTEEDLVIDAVTGLRFLPGDVASLVKAMQRVVELSENGGLRGMGEAARARVLETSTVDHMVDTFQAVVR